MEYTTNYENLANAVVEQAFKDYKNILRHLKRHPYNNSLTYEKSQIERFFLGQRLSVFTSVNGNYLVETAKKQVK